MQDALPATVSGVVAAPQGADPSGFDQAGGGGGTAAPVATLETPLSEPPEEVIVASDVLRDLLTAFFRKAVPSTSHSLYKTKLEVLKRTMPELKGVFVNDEGEVEVQPVALPLERVRTTYAGLIDQFVAMEAKVNGRLPAMLKAGEAFTPVVRQHRDSLDDLGITPILLHGLFSKRVVSGVAGFDDLVAGGIPRGMSVLLQAVTGAEEDYFANQFIKTGLENDEVVIVILSMFSPDEFREQMRTLGLRTKKYEDEGFLRIIDWYSQKNERVKNIEEEGAVIKVSKSITNLEMALDRAIKATAFAPAKRAVVRALSPALTQMDFEAVYGFAQSLRVKLNKAEITGLFLLEKEMHEEKTISSLQPIFDGVVDLERERKGDKIVRKIGVISMKQTYFDSEYHALDLTKAGLMIRGKGRSGEDAEASGPVFGAPRYAGDE